ncbi:hypothetical protein HPP92_019108 [Vanilla planifolia]|uniref:Uncharacterized protein n=1 Tax=Vanilla planifolia TaxID=51239 RepID=A0A835Q3G2_VANPL|nr:hypothetical protein HPP92_026845 [Vanilla planifolia]KAG0464944.1 hypothetical protein HPP92_019108 [Vanilla planifolia]
MQLRQLEEKQREPESYFAADLRARGKPLPSAVDVVSLKGNLMSRLQLLENRIRQLLLKSYIAVPQLSHELEKGGSDGGGGWATSSTVVAAHAKEESGSTSSQSQMQKLVVSGNEDGRVAEGTWRTGADGHRFKKKTKDAMQVATTKAMEKRAAVLCGNEQRRMDRTRLYRRWFPVGC